MLNKECLHVLGHLCNACPAIHITLSEAKSNPTLCQEHPKRNVRQSFDDRAGQARHVTCLGDLFLHCFLNLALGIIEDCKPLDLPVRTSSQREEVALKDELRRDGVRCLCLASSPKILFPVPFQSLRSLSKAFGSRGHNWSLKNKRFSSGRLLRVVVPTGLLTKPTVFNKTSSFQVAAGQWEVEISSQKKQKLSK